MLRSTFPLIGSIESWDVVHAVTSEGTCCTTHHSKRQCESNGEDNLCVLAACSAVIMATVHQDERPLLARDR